MWEFAFSDWCWSITVSSHRYSIVCRKKKKTILNADWGEFFFCVCVQMCTTHRDNTEYTFEPSKSLCGMRVWDAITRKTLPTRTTGHRGNEDHTTSYNYVGHRDLLAISTISSLSMSSAILVHVLYFDRNFTPVEFMNPTSFMLIKLFAEMHALAALFKNSPFN